MVLKKANKLYDAMAYDKAIPKFLSALKKDSMNSEIGLKLADCYRLTSKPEQAERWYSKSVKSGKGKPIHKFYYAQALMGIGKYAEARRWLEEYKKSTPGDERAENLIAAIDNINGYSEDSQNYQIEILKINSTSTDFGAVEYGDGIVFVSSRARNETVSRTNSWTGEKFLALYKATGKENEIANPKIFDKSIQTKFNDGPLCFSKSGDEMYLTGNNIEGGKTHKSKDGVIKLKIFKYKFIDNEWEFESGIPANNDQYNVAHAALSPDETKLYFASDMPGGMGGMDIYVCSKVGKGWEAPVNLGSNINTAGNEVFPFMSKDGIFYFASNGHEGLGGLDIYSAQEKNGIYADVKNLMAPMNSKNDDFSFVLNKNGQNGYFSSNRNSSIYTKTNDDNIYFFKVLKPKPQIYTISLKDSVTETDLTDSEITIADAEGNTNTLKSSKGTFTVDLIPNKTYKISTNVYAYINQQIQWLTPKKVASKYIKLQRSLGIDLEVSIKDNFLNPLGVEGLRVNIVKVNTNRTEEFLSSQNGKVNAVLQPETTYSIVASGKGKTSNKYFVNTIGISEGNKIYLTIYLDNSQDPAANKRYCLIAGQLLDLKTNEPIKDAKITLSEAGLNSKKQEATSDANGKYIFYNLELFQNYKIAASKDGYFTQNVDFSTKNSKDCKTFNRSFFMDKIVSQNTK